MADELKQTMDSKQQTTASSRWRSLAMIALRLLGVALAVYLFHVVWRQGADPLQAIRNADWRWLAGVLVLTGLPHVLGAYRWGRLLAVHGIVCSWWLLFRLTLTGTFFSLLLPGAVTGDIVKLAYVVRNNPGKEVEAVMSGLMDRVLGVGGLFCVAALGGGIFFLCHPLTVLESRVLMAALLMVVLGACAMFCMLSVLVAHRWFLRFSWILRLTDAFSHWLPKAVVRIIERLCEAADGYGSHKRELLITLLISMVIHASLGTALFCVGRAIGEMTFGYGEYFLSTQIGNAVTMVAVTPGGMGIRDSVSAAIFHACGATQGAVAVGNIPLINSLFLAFWNILGGLCAATLPGKRSAQNISRP